MAYKLHYFNGKGRAEMIRLVFAVAGKEFEDVRIERDQWPSAKSNFPFGQLPALEVDGKIYSQSMAIATFLAKEFGFYGKSNLDGLVIDQTLQLIQDLITIACKFFFDKDETKKAEGVKNFKETDSPRFFGYFEKMLKDNGSGFIVGSEISLADIAVYDIMTGMLSSVMASTEDFPLLKALVDKVGTNDNVKAYIAKRPETQF